MFKGDDGSEHTGAGKGVGGGCVGGAGVGGRVGREDTALPCNSEETESIKRKRIVYMWGTCLSGWCGGVVC